MPRNKIHVVPYGDGWAVKREGADRASKITYTKTEAVDEARKIAYRNNDEIIVHNKQGRITPGKRYGKESRKQSGKQSNDSGCYLTTACVAYYNLSDNCYQLTTLRNFRDSHLQKTNTGKKLIKQYYSLAPKIVELIDSHPDKSKFYNAIFNHINRACFFIEQQRYREAKNLYVKIVTQLTYYFQLA